MSSCSLLNGLKAGCKISMGGISKVWFFTFKEYPDSSFITDGSILVSHPDTLMYEFEQTNEVNITQSMQKDAGGKFTSFTIELETTNKKDHYEIEKFIRQQTVIIVKDRNGNYLIFGMRNGLRCNSITQAVGSVKTDFTGYKLVFEGQEIQKAYFIDDLADAGFVTNPDDITSLLLLQDNFYLLLQNGDKIELIN